ncbi:amino acid permease [Nitzschia inconspicua]|uniref:Amino acid permease n=1 Tax=Nitzschia inconspicua TaxID=303405 RepID=A0A9K3L3R9_9STRA|nr:amino acid permease [Nitzschia inconspicua]
MQRATRLLVIPSISLLVVTVNVIFLLCEVDTAKAFVTPRSTVVVAPSPSFALKVLRSPVQEEIASFNNNRPVVATDANNNSSLDGQTKSSFQLLQESINTNNKKQTFPLLEGLYEKMGTVQDERIIFPEYQAGDVPRIFSSLRYHKSEETGRISAQHATGSVLGAASLVAGTMVGAGVLALPAATAPVGFLPSTAAMGVGWMYMTMSGLLIAELSINRLGQSGKPGKGMLDMYEDSLGPRWSKIGSLAYFGLHYCLLVAYIAQGGANLNALMGMDGWNLPSGVPQASFAGLCALGLFQAPPSVVEKVNNIFVLALSCAFVGILGLGAQTANFASLIDPANQHPEHTLDAFPIIFLSLVYHNIVPTVVNQLEGDRDKITKAIIGGTTIPTLMFLAWNAVVLGNMDPSVTNSIDPVALLQASSGSGNEILSTLVSTFSSLALVTSLIGFVYGLLDGWTDVFKLPTEGPGYEKWKTPLFGLVFLPPLALSLTDPDIFYKALDVGGAFGVSTLFLVLPPIMVWKQRYGEDQQPLMTKPMVPFGKLPLGSMWKAAGTLIVEQGAEKLGVFDWFQHQFLS